MKILFLGTDQFAVPTLEALMKVHEVVAVITQPDKPRGRGKKVSPTPVKEAALKLGIPVLQPKSLKSSSIKEEVGKLDFDIMVAVAYGKLIPPDFLDKPSMGCICLHPSLLPEFRGCSPIESAILKGKTETGVTVFAIGKEFDTGDIIYQEKKPILDEETGGELRERLSVESPDAVLKTMEMLQKGEVNPIPQNADLACWAPKLEREDGEIHWEKSATEIHNLIRAFNPKPSAWTNFRNKILKIDKSRVVNGNSQEQPGTVTEINKNQGFTVACGEGQLLLLQVQPEGKNSMSGWAFVQGYKPQRGERMGEESK